MAAPSSLLRGISTRNSVFRTAPKGSSMLAPRPQQAQRQSMVCGAYDASVAAAVTQQAIAYAVVLGAEGAFSYSAVPADDKGRPQIPLVAAGMAGTAAAVALVSLGGESPVATVGLVIGLLTSAAMLTVNAKRTVDLEYNDGDWPGPKAWPATMSLISFFALSVFWQALFASFAA